MAKFNGQQLTGSAEKRLTITFDAVNELAEQAIDMRGYNLMKIEMPAVWTAADLQIRTTHEIEPDFSAPAETYQVLNAGAVSTPVVITLPIAAESYSFVGDNAASIAACSVIRFRSSAVQASARTILVTLTG